MFHARSAAVQPNGAPLCQFKAGILNASPVTTEPAPGKFKVEADNRRGQIILQRGTDGALHLFWKDRVSQQNVEDLLVFPGDQEFTRVDTGKPTDRVYLLQFKTSPVRRLFFWMQEPVNKDEEKIAEINRLMNPTAQPQQHQRGDGAPAAPVSAESEVGFDELTAILSGLGYSDNSTQQEPQQPKQQEEEETGDKPMTDKKPEVPTPALSRVLTGEALERLVMENAEYKQQLIALLPEGQQTEQELMLTLRSPQLRQSMVQFTRALRDDIAFPMILSSMGLPLTSEAMMQWESGDEVHAFISLLLQEAASKKKYEQDK